MKSTHRSTYRHTRSLLACALASCMLLAAPQVLAQSTSATIRGQVSADSTPAGGATVTATNLATGLTRSVKSSAGGGYSLAGLPPGSYRIDVAANGQTHSRDVTLAVGQTVTLNLGVGGVAETAPAGEATDLDAVVVTAPMMVETKTSEIATYVSQKQIDSLPQGTRNFLAFADTVPGMVFTQDGNGNTKLRSGAQSANSVNVFIDGVGQKSYTLPGGVPGQDTSRGNPFPQSAIGEYKVITQNYKAEFDQISSAAIVAATRSGTNEFDGSFFWDHSATGMREQTPAEEKAGTKVESKEEQYGASFGGPIIKDRLFFFVAYEAKEYNTPRTLRLDSVGRYDPNDVPAGILSQLGPSDSPFNEDMYFGKLSWSIDDANYLEFSAQARREEEITRNNGPFTADRATMNTNDVTRYDLRYQYSGERWLNDAHLTYEDTSWAPRPQGSGNGYILTVANYNPDTGERTDIGTIINAGAGSNNQDKGQKGWSVQDDLTFTGWDRHTLKMGAKYKQVDLNSMERNFSNPQFYYDINQSVEQPYRVEFGRGIPGTSEGFTQSDNKQFGIYVQDDWEVNDHLLLNLGVRWDYETTPVYEDFVTPADLAANLRAYPNIQNAEYDIEDYISDGSQREAFKGAWQPRLGFSYDIDADQRHVIFGGAGRAYDRNLFTYLQNEVKSISYASPYRISFYDADGICRNAAGCVQWDPAYLQPGGVDALLGQSPSREWYLNNNDLKVPYSDQFSVGMRNIFPMFGTDWNSEVALSHVVSKDGISIRLGNRREDGSFFPPGAEWGTPWGFDPPFGRIVLVDNMLESKSDSVFLKLEKPYTADSRWGVTLAYTYTKAERNSAEDGPGIFDYPDTSWFGWLPVVQIAPHRFVGTGIWDGPWGLTFSTKLTLESQKDRVGTNCLSTSLPGDGDCFKDSYKPDGRIGFMQWDLAVSKVWQASDDISLRVRADILNVTNRRNWNSYNDWWGFDGAAEPNFGVHNDDIALPTRTFKISFGLNW